MQKEKKNQTLQIVGILSLVILMAGLILYWNQLDQKEIEILGEQICNEHGYDFWYASGNTIRCYELNQTTGIKTEHEFWIDRDLCKEIYGDEENV